MAKKPRNPAAQDTTLINLRALKARVLRLELALVALEVKMTELRAAIRRK